MKSMVSKIDCWVDLNLIAIELIHSFDMMCIYMYRTWVNVTGLSRVLED